MQSETNFHTLVLRSEHDEITVGCFVDQYKTFLTFKHSAYQSMDETLSEHDEITVGFLVEQYKTFLTFKHSAYQSMDETLSEHDEITVVFLV